MNRLPAFLVTGLDESAMAAATIGLQFDLPSAVVVRHDLDAVAGHLVRTVSDVTGLLEREVVTLDHPCTSCAVREDVVPTLERLADLGRWGAVVAHLPVAADALSVCRVLSWDSAAAPSVRVGGVVAALDGAAVVGDLLGDALLSDRGLGVLPGDRRGVGEVLGGMVEYADAVALFGEAGDDADELTRTLARPGALVTRDWPGLSADLLLPGVHDHDATEAWVGEVHDGPSRAVESGGVWSTELTSRRPLHPGRLYEHIDALGGGPFRTRGCFWVASRPQDIGVWNGAGGLLSVGLNGRWGRGAPLTRILVTGLAEDDHRDELHETFARIPLTDAEMAARHRLWEGDGDGLETWLGPVRRAA